MPGAVKAPAIARSVVAPDRVIWSTIGRTFSARLRRAGGACLIQAFIGVSRVAELYAANSRRPQCRLGPLRDHLALVFGDRGEDVQRQPIRLWEVAGHEIDVAVHQGRNEANAPSQPVELCDNQDGLVLPACGQSGGELWTVVLLAAFDFAMLLEQFASLSGDVGVNRRALRVEPPGLICPGVRCSPGHS